MSGNIQDMKAEILAIRAKFAQVKQNVQRQHAMFVGVQKEAEKELKTLEAQGPTADEHYVLIHSIRRLMAIKSQELLTVIAQFDPDQPNADKIYQASQGKMALLNTETRFLSTYYTIVNYRPIARLLRRVASGEVAPSGTGPLGTGRLGAKTGGTGPMKGGPARPGTGPLGQRPAGTSASGPLGRPGTGPLGRSNTGPLKPPGAPAAPAAPGAGGPLGNRARLGANRPAPAPSGPLGAPAGGTGPLGSRQKLAVEMATAMAATPTLRGTFETALSQFDEIQTAIEGLAGPDLSLALPHQAAAEALNKLQGKIYYLKRTLAPLTEKWPELAYEVETTDEDLQTFLATETVQAESAVAADDGGLTSKLKSLFGGMS